MHIIQIGTIGAWKGAQERSGKTIPMVFIIFSCLLQGMSRDFKGMRGNSQPKRVIYLVSNYKKWNACLKNMTPGMVPWYGLTMPWLKVEKVWLMSSCTPFTNRTITEEVSCFREGNHQDWRGIQISVLVCHSIFFNDQHTASDATCSNLTFFLALTIFRGLFAFSRH